MIKKQWDVPVKLVKEGEVIAEFYWPAVPRVGEAVEASGRIYLVERVLWSEQRFEASRLAVRLYVTEQS